jgi:hypothetical protein
MEQIIKGGGYLLDHPDWFKIDGRTADGSHDWSAVRKPDGSWWWVAVTHIFPISGESLRIELGDQVTDKNTLKHFEETYRELLQKAEEKRAGTA